MNKQFPLIQYSAAALALISVKSAYTQAVFTDIDPDIILDEPGEFAGIDFDDDGINDFNFFNRSSFTTIPFSHEYPFHGISAGAFDSFNNGIAGYFTLISTGPGYTCYKPFALNFGDIVDENLTFYNANTQTLAKKIYLYALPDLMLYKGFWYPVDGIDIENKFLGIKFTDEDGLQRYGWIRCSIVDSANTLIIHDYAYEEKPDTGIAAGDIIGDTTEVSIQEIGNSINLYAFEQSIFIESEFESTNLLIYDILGRLVLSKNLKKGRSEVEMTNYPIGPYIVELISGVGNRSVYKVII